VAVIREPRVDAAPWASARNVLAVRLDSMGDLVMTGPAIRALGGLPPVPGGRTITLLTSPSGAGVATMLPDVDDTIVHRAPWMPGAPTDPASDLRLIDRLATRGFDAAVIFTAVTQSALPAATICRLAGIGLRAAHVRENPYSILTDWLPDDVEEPPQHEVLRQLALSSALGGSTDDDRLALAVPPGTLDAALDTLAAAGIDPNSSTIVFHPGARASSRRYDPASFAAAADALAAEGWRIVVTGSDSDREVVRAMLDAMRSRAADLCGVLSLPLLVATIANASAIVTNNTGPAHLAAAVQTPVVDLYALTNQQHTPWRAPSRVLFHDVPCKGCLSSTCREGHHDCLGKVPPAAVVDAVHELTASDRRSIARAS
jgi:lipopolysaccharide heptosyltransferase II